MRTNRVLKSKYGGGNQMKQVNPGDKVKYHGEAFFVKEVNEMTGEAVVVGVHANPFVDLGDTVKLEELEQWT